MDRHFTWLFLSFWCWTQLFTAAFKNDVSSTNSDANITIDLSDEDMLARIAAEIRASGDFISEKIEIKNINGYLTGLYSKTSLKKGEHLYTIHAAVEGEDYCDTVRQVSEMLQITDKSRLTTYEKYLTSRTLSHHSIPALWSSSGKELLEKILGEPWADFKSLHLVEDWMQRCDKEQTFSGPEQVNEHIRNAIMITIVRAENSDRDLIPIHDVVNHADGYGSNIIEEYNRKKGMWAETVRDIEAGEQLSFSYVLPMNKLLTRYGFVLSAYPKIWMSKHLDLEFSIELLNPTAKVGVWEATNNVIYHRNYSTGDKSELGVYEVTFIGNIPDERTLELIQAELERLESFESELVSARSSSIPKIELGIISQFYSALVDALLHAEAAASALVSTNILVRVQLEAQRKQAYITDKVGIRSMPGNISGVFATDELEKGDHLWSIAPFMIPDEPCEGVSAIADILRTKKEDLETVYEQSLVMSRYQFPGLWSRAGTQLLEELLGEAWAQHSYLNLIEDWIKFCDEDNQFSHPELVDENIIKAIMISVAHSGGFVPFHDIVNHGRGWASNVAVSYDDDGAVTAEARRMIEEGEQLTFSYPYSTNELFIRHGFIEAYPQLWFSRRLKLGFKIDESPANKRPGPSTDGLTVVYMRNSTSENEPSGQNSLSDYEPSGQVFEVAFESPPNDETVEQIKFELERLRAIETRITSIQSSSDVIPENELVQMIEFHNALVEALSHAQIAAETLLDTNIARIETVENLLAFVVDEIRRSSEEFVSDKVEIRSDEKMHTRFYAKAPLKKGEQLWLIHAVIAGKDSCETVEEISDLLQTTDQDVLAPYERYLASGALSRTPIPALWSPEGVEYLEIILGEAWLNEKYLHPVEDWIESCGENSEYSSPESVDEHLKNAIVIAMMQAEKNSCELIPLIDLLGHVTGSAQNVFNDYDEEDGVRGETLRDVEEGEELAFSYKIPANELFLRYGIVETDYPQEWASEHLGLNFDIEKCSLQERLGPSADGTSVIYHKNTTFNGKPLLEAFQLSFADQPNKETLLDIENELKRLRAVRKGLRSIYPSSSDSVTIPSEEINAMSDFIDVIVSALSHAQIAAGILLDAPANETEEVHWGDVSSTERKDASATNFLAVSNFTDKCELTPGSVVMTETPNAGEDGE